MFFNSPAEIIGREIGATRLTQIIKGLEAEIGGYDTNFNAYTVAKQELHAIGTRRGILQYAKECLATIT